MGFDATGAIYVAWVDHTPGHPEIYFTKSLASENSFRKPASIYKTTGASTDPRMVIDRYDHIHLAWLNTTGASSGKECVYSHSIDQGETFSPPVPISNIDAYEASDMDMAVDRNGSLLLSWVENHALYASRSINGGQTFSQPQAITEGGNPVQPHIRADENGVFYVVWEDLSSSDIFMATSKDGGLTFSKPENISANPGSSEAPWLGSHEADAYALWVDSTPGNRDIYIRRISDSGSLPVNISKDFQGDSEGPMAGFDGTGNIHLVWEDHTSGNAAVMYAKSIDKGMTFSGIRDLSNTAAPSKSPQISVSSGVIRVLWVEEISSSNKELYLSTSLDSGLSFTDPINISETPGISEGPLMGIDTSEIAHWVWVEGPPGSREIYHRKERR